ncbi:MAG: GTP-binding protein [Desulfobacula sp.]|nr:GTP-binding protein [Desulfobacula sp.]
MKTKIFIITGFLGTGKTTLLKRILESSADLSKTVVLINEFGKIGIDKSLIKNTAAADIVELTSGCICCSLKTDMIQSLQILRHEYAPERLVIEATGVADPLSIIQALNDRIIKPHFELEKVITVVDSDFWEAREVFGTVFQSQLDQADIILLNKIDVLDETKISIVLKEIKEESANGFVIPTLHCNIDPDIIWSQLEQENQDVIENSSFQLYDPAKDYYSPFKGESSTSAEDAGFITFSFETVYSMDKELFMEFLNSIPLELFRIKGPVKFADRTEMLNFAGGKIQWLKWPDTVNTCLAFIGWHVVEEEIMEKLNNCII